METIYAVVENGIVTNTIVADETFVATYYPSAVRIDQLDPVPGIGWSYDGTNFTAPSE